VRRARLFWVTYAKCLGASRTNQVN